MFIKNKGGLKLSSYIHFTEEERERARNTDLVELLKSQGETLKSQVVNMNGLTEHRRSLSEETFGFISMKESAVMQ